MSPENLAKLKDQIKRHEGVRLKPYKDTVGLWTIGVGHLLGETLPEKYKNGITQEECDALYEKDFQKHKNEVDVHIPWAQGLDDLRYAVLINMAFNLGINGLMKFKNTLKNVKEGCYGCAARGMLLSKWAVQVKGRATELSEQMKTGKWVK